MISFSIIKKSQLEGALRLDAEYYQPEYFIDFKKGNWQSISSVLKICQYGLSQAMNDKKTGYPMFKMNDIENAFLVDDNIRYANIPENIFNNFKLEKDDVLFNRVNSEEFVGRTGIFKLDFKSTFASYLIRLQVNEKSNILPDYLNIFLNSKFGLKQIKRFLRRAVNQANVNAEELKRFKIAMLPIRFQGEIKKISNDSWDNFQLSKDLYQQSENLFLEELDLKNLDKKESLSSVVNLSDVLEAKRMDAEYFKDKYKTIQGKIEKYNHKKLEDVIQVVPAKFEAIKNPKDIFKYVELSNINPSVGIIDGFSEVSGREAPSRAKRVLETGDVIVSSVEGSLEKVALVNEGQEKYLASTGFFQFRSKEILPEVLLVLAKSIVFQFQLEKRCAGTILTAVPKESINNILVPILPKEIQQKIADLVKKLHEARKKSKELLEEAKKKVEEMIERQ